MVFTCSYSDFFIPEADDWRNDAYNIVLRTPHLIYQILTKRIECVPDRLPIDWANFHNAWLGVTAETQEMADIRVKQLIQINKSPNSLNFVSVEPMLEEIDLRSHNSGLPMISLGIDWVICGCESGTGAQTDAPGLGKISA